MKNVSMKHPAVLALFLIVATSVSLLRAAEPVAEPARPTPAGDWKWFSGRDIVIHPDGFVTYPGNFGFWKWTDEGKRRLEIEWKSFRSTDDLTLSDDGKSLRSNQPVRGLGSDGVEGVRIVSPLGAWRMNKGALITFKEDHTAAFAGATSGFWYWTDEDQRKFKVEWTTIPYVDQMTISDDGGQIEGINHIADRVTGVRIAQTPPAASAETAKSDENGVTPVGKWRWFYGPDLTFGADGTVNGTNRDAHWTWTDRAKRELRIDFGGQWAAYHDSLTLSENGNHLEGHNNADMRITGDRITPANSAVPAAAAGLLGAWAWPDNTYLTFHADGSFVTTGDRSGRWSWADEAKRELQLIWEDKHKDQLKLSEGGNVLTNNHGEGDFSSSYRVPREPGEPPTPTIPPAPGSATPAPTSAAPPAASVSPVGLWSWFVGPDLTFKADGNLTGTNRVAKWKWIDESARKIEIVWEGVQAGLIDQLLLSSDGKSVEGHNNDGVLVTGQRIETASDPDTSKSPQSE